MLKKDMCITETGQAVLELKSSKDGSGESSLKLEDGKCRFQLLELPITAEIDVTIEQ